MNERRKEETDEGTKEEKLKGTLKEGKREVK